MKFPLIPALAAAATLLGGAASGAVITENYNFTGLGLSVPDGNPAGTLDIRTLSSTIQVIQSVQVTFSLSGSFNGDLYAYVSSESAVSVLLNRVGKTGVNPVGYSDDGFNVTFDDSAANNIHNYQTIVIPAGGAPLTGIWQPDGRNVNPNVVTDATPADSLLSNFIGTSAAGTWTLFVADLSSGEIHTVDSWGLVITGDTVPEPAAPLLLGTAAMAGLLGRRRRAAS
jgi:subtilisin-like proprotein convertase family protein